MKEHPPIFDIPKVSKMLMRLLRLMLKRTSCDFY